MTDLLFADATSIIGTVGAVLGVLVAIIVPFILQSLSKRGKEWDELKQLTTKLQNENVLQAAQLDRVSEKVDTLNMRCGDAANRTDVEMLRNQIDQLKDIERQLHREFVTVDRYQRDIDSFEKIVQLLRDTIQQQTDMLERFRKAP